MSHSSDPDDAPTRLTEYTNSQRGFDGDAPMCGGVYWVDQDPNDGVAPNHRHPHVVIQDDVLNHSRIHTVVVCAITSNPSRAAEPGNVRLDAGEANLPKPSVVVVSQVSSLSKSRLGAHIGMLSRDRVEQIYAGLRLQQRSHFRGR